MGVEVRKGEQALIYSVVDAPVEPEFRRELLEILDVPERALGLPLGAGTVAQGAAGCVGPGGRRRRWSVPGTFAG